MSTFCFQRFIRYYGIFISVDNNTLEVVVESQITRKQDAVFDALRGLDNPGMIDSSIKAVMLW